MRVLTSIGSSVVAVVLVAAPATAQPPAGLGSPVVQPPFSPYMNLLRQGSGATNPAINYYGIVRPQTQLANSVQSLQYQANQLNPLNPAGNGADAPITTGVQSGFQNHRLYFQNQYSLGGAGGGRTGAGGAGFGVGRYGAGGNGQVGYGAGGGASFPSQMPNAMPPTGLSPAVPAARGR